MNNIITNLPIIKIQGDAPAGSLRVSLKFSLSCSPKNGGQGVEKESRYKSGTFWIPASAGMTFRKTSPQLGQNTEIDEADESADES
jgi:hypothetical protein